MRNVPKFFLRLLFILGAQSSFAERCHNFLVGFPGHVEIKRPGFFQRKSPAEKAERQLHGMLDSVLRIKKSKHPSEDKLKKASESFDLAKKDLILQMGEDRFYDLLLSRADSLPAAAEKVLFARLSNLEKGTDFAPKLVHVANQPNLGTFKSNLIMTLMQDSTLLQNKTMQDFLDALDPAVIRSAADTLASSAQFSGKRVTLAEELERKSKYKDFVNAVDTQLRYRNFGSFLRSQSLGYHQEDGYYNQEIMNRLERGEKKVMPDAGFVTFLTSLSKRMDAGLRIADAGRRRERVKLFANATNAFIRTFEYLKMHPENIDDNFVNDFQAQLWNFKYVLSYVEQIRPDIAAVLRISPDKVTLQSLRNAIADIKEEDLKPSSAISQFK